MASKKEVETARGKRKAIMKVRQGHIDKMKAAYKAGKKDEAKGWRDKAISVAERAKAQADIMIGAKSYEGRKAHAAKSNKRISDKVAVWQKRVDEGTKNKIPAAKLARYKTGLGVITERQKKRKKRMTRLVGSK